MRKPKQLTEAAIRFGFESLFDGVGQVKPSFDGRDNRYKTKPHRDMYACFKHGVRMAEALHRDAHTQSKKVIDATFEVVE